MAHRNDKRKVLHFVIIGAQKSGTTTLFEHLRHHPELYLPPSKEAPFFNRPELYARGAHALFDLYFQKAPQAARLGKVTPDYMADDGVPSRLALAFPSIRLLAILRDPVRRAHSEYLMEVHRGLESRTFEGAIEQLLTPGSLHRARHALITDKGYVVRGEYGRILSGYSQFFPREQILVVYSQDLETQPREVLRRIHEHLEIADVEPPELGARFFEGGARPRLPGLVVWARNVRVFRSLWRTLPMRTRDLLFHRFEVWNTRAPALGEPLPIGSSVESVLREHFRDDTSRLAELFETTPPWLR